MKKEFESAHNLLKQVFVFILILHPQTIYSNVPVFRFVAYSKLFNFLHKFGVDYRHLFIIDTQNRLKSF